MYTKVIIEPIDRTGRDLILTALHTTKHGTEFINDFGEVIRWKGEMKDIPSYKRWKFTSNMSEIEYKFNNEKKEDGELTTQSDKIIKNQIEWFKRDERFTVNGKRTEYTKGTPIFNVREEENTVLSNIADFQKKLLVANKINNMPFGQKRDLSFYYGESPKGMTELELLVHLAGWDDGICMQDALIDDFILVWGKDLDNDLEMKVIIRKAIELGVFTNQAKDGKDFFYYGQEFIGNQFEDLLAYCKREEKIYEQHILRNVEKEDKFKKEQEASDVQKKTIGDHKGNPGYTQEQLNILREEAKALRIPASHVTGYFPLLKKVEAAKKNKHLQLQNA